MKKLFPEVPDVPQGVANRAVKIIEKHLRMHRVDRARDLPEEAKVRLYRDLRFYFESDAQPPGSGSDTGGFSTRRFLSSLWEKVENFLSVCEAWREAGPVTVFTWSAFGDPARYTVIPRGNSSSTCRECS